MEARPADRSTTAPLLQFVMKHAPGARALRFVRRLPLLKGLSDNMLISVAERMGSETFEVGTCAAAFCATWCQSWRGA